MGCVNTITHDTFPRQGDFLGQRMKVLFHYDTSKLVYGKCVRDDVEEPYRMIIELEDGRHIMSTECQYSPAADSGVFMNEAPVEPA